MYPKSADTAQVGELTERVVAHFKRSPGFRSASVSVDALMGPGARAGEFARVLIVDFNELEDALTALNNESFQEVLAADEAVGATHFLFECRDL